MGIVSESFSDSFSGYALAVVVTLTALSSFLSFFAKFLSQRKAQALRDEISIPLVKRPIIGAPAPILASRQAFDVARGRVESRLREVEASRSELTGTYKLSRLASIALSVGQYIVGGVLASSFVQESLTPKAVGAFGVLVLVASLVREQFHPEVNAKEARKKAFQLLALQRSSDDQLAILDAKSATGQDHSDAMIALLTQVTQRLGEIENPETLPTKS
jgi:hypothetical protein